MHRDLSFPEQKVQYVKGKTYFSSKNTNTSDRYLFPHDKCVKKKRKLKILHCNTAFRDPGSKQ